MASGQRERMAWGGQRGQGKGWGWPPAKRIKEGGWPGGAKGDKEKGWPGGAKVVFARVNPTRFCSSEPYYEGSCV
jgi:hypothetical protein